jgi:hypothetical protein
MPYGLLQQDDDAVGSKDIQHSKLSFRVPATLGISDARTLLPLVYNFVLRRCGKLPRF